MIGEMQKSFILRRTEILIVLANSAEYDGFLNRLKVDGLDKEVVFVLNDFELHAIKINDYHICYSFIDGTGPGHASKALNTIADNFVNLKYIINIGCCASSSEKVEKTVIFADRMFDADARKEKDGKTQFAIYENRHYKFSNLIRSKIRLKNYSYTVKFEPLIASSAVIKDEIIKGKYVQAYPYAAGIEMEGIAISNYALSRGIEWAVIKGISDNGIDKNGSEGQKEASYNATDLFLKMINRTAFERGRINVFVGGAISKTASTKESLMVEKNCYHLAQSLLKENYKIINGLGWVVGNSMVSAVYTHKRDFGCDQFDDYMEIHTFPRVVDGSKKKTVRQFYSQNRQNMIEKCVFSIFVFGRNTKQNEENGMYEEFNIAGSKYVPRIVIPSKNYFSKSLYEAIIESNVEGVLSEKYCEKYKMLSVKNAFQDNITLALELLKLLDDYYFGIA